MAARSAPSGIAVRSAHELIGRFIQIDQIGVALGALLVVAVNGFFVEEPDVWLALIPLGLLFAMLVAAHRLLAPDQLTPSLSLIAVGNWIAAVSIALLFPFLWPVMVLTAIMPLLLATPYLDANALIVSTGVAALVGGVVAISGLLSDDGGVLPDIDDAAEIVLVTGALIGHMVPMALIVRQQKEIQAAALVESERLNTELRESEAALDASRRRIVEAGDRERARIERDLHDGAQQRLVAARLRLGLLADGDVPPPNDALDELADDIGAALDELRELAHGIYPPVLESGGLTEGIAALVRRAPAPVHVATSGIVRYDRSIETAVYFTVLEALTNVAKHAPDAPVDIELIDRVDPDGARRLMLTVADDGPGFDPDAFTQSRGLVNVNDRIRAVGGTVEIVAGSGIGTRLAASLPVTSSSSSP